MRLVHCAILSFPLFAAVHAFGQSAQPLGDEFQINSYTTGSQEQPQVATQPGGFVVVWRTQDIGNPSSPLHGRRLDAAGQFLGAEFQINSLTTAEFLIWPSVATAPNGDFVVAWQSYGSPGTDTSYDSVQARRFASDGSTLGAQFQVNTYTTYSQYSPAVAIGPAGDFMIIWESYKSDTPDNFGSLQAQRYSNTGTQIGNQFQVNTYSFGPQVNASVDTTSNGDFVVVWQSYHTPEDDLFYGIVAQKLAADGSKIGAEFQVNTYTTAYQRFPVVGVGPDDGFTVVWESYGSFGSDNDLNSIQGQKYDAGGQRVGGEFQVNTFTTYRQVQPSVALTSGGGFIVTWTSQQQQGSSPLIGGQLYASDGAPVGGQFQVNNFTTGFPGGTSIAMLSGGQFIVSWSDSYSTGNDNDNRSVQGRAFTIPEVVSIGMETGDFSGWSSFFPVPGP